MFSKSTSNNKKLLTTIEDTTIMLLEAWSNQKEFSFIDGCPCYMSFTNNGLVFTAGTCRIEIERIYDVNNHKSIEADGERYEIVFEFSEMDHTVRYPNRILTMNPDGVIMHYVTTGKKTETISIPYESINEVDFFQYETLGVICPLTAGTLTKLVEAMREIL